MRILLAIALGFVVSGCGPMLGTLGFSRGLPVGPAEWSYDSAAQSLRIHIQPGGATGSDEYGYQAALSGTVVRIRGYAEGTFGPLPQQYDRDVTVSSVPPGHYDLLDDVTGKTIGRIDTAVGHGQLTGDLL